MILNLKSDGRHKRRHTLCQRMAHLYMGSSPCQTACRGKNRDKRNVSKTEKTFLASRSAHSTWSTKETTSFVRTTSCPTAIRTRQNAAPELEESQISWFSPKRRWGKKREISMLILWRVHVSKVHVYYNQFTNTLIYLTNLYRTEWTYIIDKLSLRRQVFYR